MTWIYAKILTTAENYFKEIYAQKSIYVLKKSFSSTKEDDILEAFDAFQLRSDYLFLNLVS